LAEFNGLESAGKILNGAINGMIDVLPS